MIDFWIRQRECDFTTVVRELAEMLLRPEGWLAPVCALIGGRPEGETADQNLIGYSFNCADVACE